MKSSFAIAALALAASACALDETEPAAHTLLVPEDVELHWDAAFNATEDGLGAVIPVDVMVYDGVTGEPREGVMVELQGPVDTYVLTEGELVRMDAEECVDCALFWDAFRDHYYAVDIDLDEAVVTRVRTGPEGLARVHVLVDSLAREGDAFSPANMQVTTDSVDASFLLIPR